MGRWLLALLCALVLVPVAAPQAATTVRACAGDLGLIVLTEGENTTARIGVSMQNNDPRPCRVSLPLSVTILLGKRAAHIAGNPLEHRPSHVLRAREEAEVLVADWQNWCSSRIGISVVVRYGGLVTRQALPVLPSCVARSRPSRLLLAR